MSVHVMSRVWRIRVSASEKLVLLKLADCANDEGRNAYPAVATIAAETCLSVRTVRSTLSSLRKSGMIIVEQEANSSTRRTTTYRLDLDVAGASERPKGRAICRGADPAGVQEPQVTPARAATLGMQQLPETPARAAAKPSMNHQQEPSRNRQGVSCSSADLSIAIEKWNELADRTGLARVQRPTAKRKTALRKRLADVGGLAGWQIALEKVEASPFMCGQNDRGWRADFDFVVRQSSFTKLLEGTYDDRARESQSQSLTDALARLAHDANAPTTRGASYE